MIRTANKAALYARFSSDNQRSESIDAQLRAMQEYCKQRRFSIVSTYVDEAKSATTDRRPSFQQMIADSGSHTFNILLVHKLDRFARNRYDSAVYKRELKKNGVTVYSVLENLDDSPESIMMESVLEGMSEYYSQNLAREVMKGMRETALQGKHTGGQPPLGYTIDPVTKKLIIDEAEAETVRIIYSMYAAGYGYSSILDRLHEKNCLTKCGNEFQKNSLYSILTNPKYQGLYVFNRSSSKSATGTRNSHLLKDSEEVITIEGGCPQLVEPSTFDIVQKRIAENKYSGGRNNAKENYLFSGKVFCQECGRAMVGNSRIAGRSKDYYSTYRCPSKRYTCTNKEINREYLEAYVIGVLEREIFNPSAMKALMKRIEKHKGTGGKARENELAAIDAKLADTETALNNVADAVSAGLLSDVLVARLNELEAEKARLITERARLTSIGNSAAVEIDQLFIPTEYNRLRESPVLPAYKAFVQGYLRCIVVGRYTLAITIKTGLDIFPALDTTLTVRRQEVYGVKK